MTGLILFNAEGTPSYRGGQWRPGTVISVTQNDGVGGSWALVHLCHNVGLLCHLLCSLASFLKWLGLGYGLWPGSRMSLWGKLAGLGDVPTLIPLALLLDRQPCH